MDAGFPLSGSVMTVSGAPAKNAQVVGRLSDSLLMAPGRGPCQPRIAGKHYLRDQFSQPVMRLTSHQAEAICRLYGALVMALGDRRIDVLVKDGRTPAAPIFDAARRTGVLL